MATLGMTALLSGCGDSDDQRPPTDAEALCALYEAACARQAECGVYLYSATTDVEQCLAELGCATTAASMAASGVIVATPAARACADAVAAATCAELEPWQDGRPASFIEGHPLCDGVLVGTQEEGGACAWAQQCKPGLTCAGETCPGACEVDTSACQRDSCPAGQFCAFDGCRPVAQRGEACEFSDGMYNTCADGLYCRIEFGQPAGVCGDPTPRDGACTDLSFFVCEDGDACISNTCQPIRALGAACNTATDCGLDNFCDFTNGNRCAPARAVGAACGQVWGECGFHADCDAGVCQPLAEPAPAPLVVVPTVGLGADCRAANCARGLACRPSGAAADPAWVCEPAAALGASCEPADPDLRFALLFNGQRAVDACLDGVCDVLGSPWTCVSPKPPGAACSREGLTIECASAHCSAGVCAEFFVCP